jgi:putative acetyltransferase
MSLIFARTKRAREPTYPRPIRFERRSSLTVVRQDTDWPEFFWCVTPDGLEGWVHESCFTRTDSNSARAVRDYDAIEHRYSADEWMQPIEQLGGWSWCVNSQGKLGWVPDEDLERGEAPRFNIRAIEEKDDARMAGIIRTVMPEYGAVGDGFAINDPEVDYMTRAYSESRCAYFVVEIDDVVLGGGGIAPLQEGDGNTCELRKMYFLPQLRGQGAGNALIAHCLRKAREFGYQQCYLETLDSMKEAQRLYEGHGFEKRWSSLGNTGHCGCDTYYVLKLV